jgi:bacterioferritin-associated ferredoxin
MIICVCHPISDRDIAQATRQGCASFDELQIALSVATRCGKCHDSARETLELHLAPYEASRQAAVRSAEPGRPRVMPIANQTQHHPLGVSHGVSHV